MANAPKPFAAASELPFRFELAFGFWELVSPDPDWLALDEPLSELAGFTESLDAELDVEAFGGCAPGGIAEASARGVSEFGAGVGGASPNGEWRRAVISRASFSRICACC
jgi:hypothetical protein